MTVTCEHHTILCVEGSSIFVCTHTKHFKLQVCMYMDGYNCIICCTMNPLPVVYFRRLVYEHNNELCRIVEYFVVKKFWSKPA